MRIHKNDSRDLSFVICCLFSQCISLGEFRRWSLSVVNDYENVPDYFFNLIDYSGFMKDIYAAIGFVPDWEPTEDEWKSMYGIAYIRGIVPYDAPKRDLCLRMLKENKHILAKYRALLRFIEIDEVQSLN